MAKTIKFGSFEPVILAPTVEEVKDIQESRGSARSQIDANDDDEGWTFVTRRKGGKMTPTKLAKASERSKMVRKSTKKQKPKVAKKKVTQAKRKRAFRQKSITLNEYMPEEFRDEGLVPMTCYHIDGDVENEDNIDKLAFEASQSSTTRINFSDENLLLGLLLIIGHFSLWDIFVSRMSIVF